jgi:hypothetical protein
MAQQGAAGLSRVRHGSVRCGMAQLVECWAAVRRPRVRISARHPSGDPLPELAAMKKLERNSANVMNECV